MKPAAVPGPPYAVRQAPPHAVRLLVAAAAPQTDGFALVARRKHRHVAGDHEGVHPSAAVVRVHQLARRSVPNLRVPRAVVGAQMAAIRGHLAKHPEIELVWWLLLFGASFVVGLAGPIA